MKRSKKRLIAKLLLLAVCCFSAMQLLFCFLFAPALFARIVAPVVALSRTLENRLQSWTIPPDSPDQTPPQAPQVADAPLFSAPSLPPDERLTRLIRKNGVDILSGGNIPITYYQQNDEAWSESLYGNDPIGTYGCGPTVMAMVVSSMNQQPFAPPQMAQWASKAGYWAAGSGSYLSLVEGAARAHDLFCCSLSGYNADELCRELAAGGVVVALMGPGHFTGSGHFILLRGISLSGQILVADPNSLANSLVPWDASLIVEELSTSTHAGAPLWLIRSSSAS